MQHTSTDMCLDPIMSYSPGSSFDLMAWFSAVRPYLSRCAFPNYVQSIYQSSCKCEFFCNLQKCLKPCFRFVITKCEKKGSEYFLNALYMDLCILAGLSHS